jgi:hypothetical protein
MALYRVEFMIRDGSVIVKAIEASSKEDAIEKAKDGYKFIRILSATIYI